MIRVCCANQGKITLVRNRENNATILALEKVALVMIIELGHHDVRTTHQPHTFAAVQSKRAVQYVANPRPSGVHDHLRAHIAQAVVVF